MLPLLLNEDGVFSGILVGALVSMIITKLTLFCRVARQMACYKYGA